ncbi:hypothetical protein DL96DRAFT_1809871 [Flagelloscypha sp. PMI_526]|nr:hypothetical protein DL96DRAFT_1809871 [Flagelloscypha sp. PMI_526]
MGNRSSKLTADGQRKSKRKADGRPVTRKISKRRRPSGPKVAPPVELHPPSPIPESQLSDSDLLPLEPQNLNEHEIAHVIPYSMSSRRKRPPPVEDTSTIPTSDSRELPPLPPTQIPSGGQVFVEETNLPSSSKNKDKGSKKRRHKSHEPPPVAGVTRKLSKSRRTSSPPTPRQPVQAVFQVDDLADHPTTQMDVRVLALVEEEVRRRLASIDFTKNPRAVIDEGTQTTASLRSRRDTPSPPLPALPSESPLIFSEPSQGTESEVMGLSPRGEGSGGILSRTYSKGSSDGGETEFHEALESEAESDETPKKPVETTSVKSLRFAIPPASFTSTEDEPGPSDGYDRGFSPTEPQYNEPGANGEPSQKFKDKQRAIEKDEGVPLAHEGINE